MFFFFFKQKTAYDMRISDWSSDVCSSDLANLLDDRGTRTQFADRTVDSLCPFCGVGCQTTVHVKDDKILYIDGRDGPANQNRLCVKGRLCWDYIYSPHPLNKPLIRRD